MMLRKSIERLRNSEVAVQSPILAEKLTHYAGILAAEGSLSTAMSYLPEDTDQVTGRESRFERLGLISFVTKNGFVVFRLGSGCSKTDCFTLRESPSSLPTPTTDRLSPRLNPLLLLSLLHLKHRSW